MSKVIKLQTKTQVDFKKPVRLDLEGFGEFEQLMLNVDANLQYLTRNALENFVKGFIGQIDSHFEALLDFQKKVADTETNRQKRAERKRLRKLVQDFIDSEGKNWKAELEFLDAILDALENALISRQVGNRIGGELANLKDKLKKLATILYSDDDERIIDALDYREAIKQSQARLNRYVYMLV